MLRGFADMLNSGVVVEKQLDGAMSNARRYLVKGAMREERDFIGEKSMLEGVGKQVSHCSFLGSSMPHVAVAMQS